VKTRSENEAALLRGSGGRRGRHGCLGCLGTIVAALVFGSLVVLGLIAALTPWAFYLGGSFHIIPSWQGWGTLHAKSGDYPLFVRFGPAVSGRSRVYPTSRLKGIGYLCTPRGERFRMNLTGYMRLHLPVHTDGEAISLGMDNWPALTGGFMTIHRPSIGLVGHWRNPDLVMDDHSSLYRAFNADGSVIEKIPPNRPYNGEVVPVTIKPGTYDDFEAACRAGR
jgi:hypothetical protein